MWGNTVYKLTPSPPLPNSGCGWKDVGVVEPGVTPPKWGAVAVRDFDSGSSFSLGKQN